MSGDFNFECDKCPRTFKLEEFYEKHKKVHELKKQHRCDVCGFVYGAAKGLEGHLKTHTDLQLAHAAATQRALAAVQRAPNASPPNSLPSESPEPAFPGFPLHLNPKGVLAQAKPLSPNKKESNGHKTNHLGKKLTQSLVQSLDKSPSPAGTGNYEIYADAPDIKDANTAVQNESGFFMCSICTREFSGLNSLKKHVPIHTRRIQHKCDVCGYVFGKKEYLLDHMRKHTGEVSPVCDVCGQTFNKSLKLKEHFKLHRNVAGNGAVNQVNPFRCHVCKIPFSRPELLGIHLNTDHAETVYKCDICEATFGDVRGKNHHMYNEHQLDAFHQKCVWCPVCNQGFTRHYNLKVHMYKSHGKEYIENNFSAAELASLIKPPPGTSASGTARASSSTSTNTINNISNCYQGLSNSSTKLTATALTNTLAQLSPELPASLGKAKHYFDQGKGVQMLSCQMCPQQFLRKSDLYIHLDSDHGVILYGCTSCEDKFDDIMDLQDHVSQAHPGKAMGSPSTDEPPQFIVKRRPGPASKTNAPMESRGSSSSKVLSEIVKNLAANAMANAIPIQRCDFCSKVLETPAKLRDHILNIHLKGFHYTCDLCEKAFPHQDHLDAHYKEKHPNLRKRAQNLRNGLGLEDAPPSKRARYNSNNINCLQDKHVKETDDMRPGLLAAKAEAQAAVAAANQAATANPQPINNGLSPASQLSSNDSSNNNVLEDKEADIAASPSNCDSSLNETPESPAEVMEEDDVRYEAITEPFLFEQRVIYPCYVTLPFVADELVEAACFPKHAMLSDDDEDEEAPLTIDESIAEDEQSQDHIRLPNNLSNNLQLTAASLLGLAGNGNGNYNVEDTTPQIDHGFYPTISDYSLPISLTQIWKRNLKQNIPEVLQQLEHLEKIEAMKKFNGSLVNGGMESREERMAREQKSHSVSPPSSPPRTKPSPASAKAKKKIVSPHLSHQEYSPSKKSPRKPAPADNAVVSDYEVKIQNDHWPIQCIKCNIITGDLENFNLHMNDHWSEDKCCPVCGLLINSKRFNFKQHLKIHTGEKPFVCNICNRSFRQKAHMVKHVTTHRTMPNASDIGESPPQLEVK